MQARAPNSPVIIVATHYDKLSFRQAKEECRECQEYIGTCKANETSDKRKGIGSTEIGATSLQRTLVAAPC